MNQRNYWLNKIITNLINYQKKVFEGEKKEFETVIEYHETQIFFISQTSQNRFVKTCIYRQFNWAWNCA